MHNIRYNLVGTGYKTGHSASSLSGGCPSGICRGYELTTNLDFDKDGDGSTWSVSGDVYTLDAGDSAPYFDASSGWTPIGNANNPFQAVFKGNGWSINNLAIATSDKNIGLFGVLGVNAEVREVNITNTLVQHTGVANGNIRIGTRNYNTRDEITGIPEVFVNGSWGLIYTRPLLLSNESALVACRSLGYTSGTVTRRGVGFDGRFVLNYLRL